MKFVGLDCETYPILNGLLAPPLVCVSTSEPELYGVRESRKVVEELLRASDVTIVGANVAFDMAVLAVEWPELLPKIVAKYDAGLVSDVQIREMLLDIQRGDWRTMTDENGEVVRTGYSLADLAKARLGVTMDKTTWRLGYGKFRDVPVNEWPQGAKEYAVGDARITLDVFHGQNETCPCVGAIADCYAHNHTCNLVGEADQNRAAFQLHLRSCWGIRSDARKTTEFKTELERRWIELSAGLMAEDLMRANGTKNLEKVRARLEMTGFVVLRTPTGKIKLDADSLTESGDQVLANYVEAMNVQKLLRTYVPVLERGVKVPIQPRYHVLARSGRTSCSKPNLQNLPKEPGVRECVVPRPGFVFAFCDYSILELRCLAQALLKLFGKSRMAERLQAGHELHLALAAQILGISYEEALLRKKDPDVKDARQLAKVGNFGFPGGMGPKKLVDFARSTYGLRLTVEKCERLRKDWFATFPEMYEYFDWIAREIGSAGSHRHGEITQIGGRIRGGVGFTDAANTMFQGLAADGTKAAGWEIMKACYVDEGSPLFGSRAPLFVHDEDGLEVPESRAHEALAELERIMKTTMSKFLPGIPVEVSGLLSRYWSKEAERVEENGRATAWNGQGV